MKKNIQSFFFLLLCITTVTPTKSEERIPASVVTAFIERIPGILQVSNHTFLAAIVTVLFLFYKTKYPVISPTETEKFDLLNVSFTKHNDKLNAYLFRYGDHSQRVAHATISDSKKYVITTELYSRSLINGLYMKYLMCYKMSSREFVEHVSFESIKKVIETSSGKEVLQFQDSSIELSPDEKSVLIKEDTPCFPHIFKNMFKDRNKIIKTQYRLLDICNRKGITLPQECIYAYFDQDSDIVAIMADNSIKTYHRNSSPGLFSYSYHIIDNKPSVENFPYEIKQQGDRYELIDKKNPEKYIKDVTKIMLRQNHLALIQERTPTMEEESALDISIQEIKLIFCKAFRFGLKPFILSAADAIQTSPHITELSLIDLETKKQTLIGQNPIFYSFSASDNCSFAITNQLTYHSYDFKKKTLLKHENALGLSIDNNQLVVLKEPQEELVNQVKEEIKTFIEETKETLQETAKGIETDCKNFAETVQTIFTNPQKLAREVTPKDIKNPQLANATQKSIFTLTSANFINGSLAQEECPIEEALEQDENDITFLLPTYEYNVRSKQINTLKGKLTTLDFQEKDPSFCICEKNPQDVAYTIYQSPVAILYKIQTCLEKRENNQNRKIDIIFENHSPTKLPDLKTELEQSINNTNLEQFASLTILLRNNNETTQLYPTKTQSLGTHLALTN